MYDRTRPNPRQPRGYEYDPEPTQPAYAPLPDEAIYGQEYQYAPPPPPRARRRGRGRVERVRRERPTKRGQRGLLGGYTPKAIIFGIGAGLSAFGLLTLMTVLGAYFYFQIFELILPGVHVGDIALGGMSRTEAAQTLIEAWGSGEGVIVSVEDQNWVASPTEFGMTLDPSDTVKQAYNVGHEGPIFGEMMTMADSTFNGRAIAPQVSFDIEVARAGLTHWAAVIDTPAQDASLRIENGEVAAVPGAAGYRLDTESTLRILAADPALAIQDGYVPLVLEPVAPRITDVSSAINEARALLASPLTVVTYDAISDEHLEWVASPDTLAGWLGVETTDSGPHVTVESDRLSGWLGEINTGLGAGRTVNAEESAPLIEAALREGHTATLTIRHTPTAYTVEGGDTLISISWKVGMPYWRIVDANPELDADTLSPGQVLTIPSKDDLLPLPVIASKRVKVSISEQHLWAYENGQEIYSFVISTGIDRSPTQPGIFQVQAHDLNGYASLWDLNMPHFLSIYESWPGFFNGFHGLPNRGGGQVLWENSLGSPTSYGCIILNLEDGETLYHWAEDGTVVEIVE